MKKDFLKLLQEFVSIQSVSADSSYTSEITKAVTYLVSYLSSSGLDVKTITGYENPIIIAKTPRDKRLQTILVYGHYDVQPACITLDPTYNQFLIKQEQEKLYGRGVADNKGQILIHLYSVIELMRKKKLGFNVIFLIEGNEETGSGAMKKFLEENKKALQSDYIVVSDGEFGTGNTPALEISFRGAGSFEVFLETNPLDLHSGLFGGVAPNAAEELGKIVGNLTEFTGRKTGFKPSTKRYETRRGLESTVEVTGFTSGYNGKGFRNSIPGQAVAKINVRSTPREDPKDLMKKVQKFILKMAPKYVNIKFVNSENARGITLDVNNPLVTRAGEIIQKLYNRAPLLKNSGGTLPIAGDFKKTLNIPQVMVPLADENCGAHSASEYMSLINIDKGLEFSKLFFSDYKI